MDEYFEYKKKVKERIEKNKIEYEKIMSQHAAQIENYLEKNSEISKIQYSTQKNHL